MRISVVIPALNEAENLPRLIAAIPSIPGCELKVIVADNGSTDGTARIAEKAGAVVVTEPRRGYGWACDAGVRAALESEWTPKSPDFGQNREILDSTLQAQSESGVVVFLDGDYSSDPAEMPVLIKPILDNRADMVLGSRLLSGAKHAMLPHQTFGNWLTAFLMRRLYGLAVTDLAPYRAVKTELLRALDLREMTFGYPTEMLAKAARRKARILEAPVSFLPRLAGRSKVSGTLKGTVLAAWFILSTTIRYARG
jgi:glycosyltransferase involved in cell wall biosynthesis